MGAAVQFWGLQNVINAYDLRGIDTWAIFHGKQFITAGGGNDMLRKFLDMLAAGGGSAVYMLKVYKNIDDPEEITDTTPCSGSFNFNLVGETASVGGAGGGNAALLLRIADLERKNKELEEGDEEETITGALIGLLHEPEKIPYLINGLKMLFGSGMSPQLAMGNSNPIARAQDPGQPQLVAGTDEDRLQRLSAALTILEKQDARILEHLEALARLSTQNPQFFLMLVGQLDNMK